MDSVLCSWDKKQNKLEFVCANNDLYLIRDNELVRHRADRMPVGYQKEFKSFTHNKIEIKKDDGIYIFSDGYQDQFGGKKNKKFGQKRFKELLLEIQDKSMEEQKETLSKSLGGWRKDGEQVDDILVMGVKF